MPRGREGQKEHMGREDYTSLCVGILGIVIHYDRENMQKDTASWRNTGSKEMRVIP